MIVKIHFSNGDVEKQEVLDESSIKTITEWISNRNRLVPYIKNKNSSFYYNIDHIRKIEVVEV
jgi:hypothetical protein